MCICVCVCVCVCVWMHRDDTTETGVQDSVHQRHGQWTATSEHRAGCHHASGNTGQSCVLFMGLFQENQLYAP